MIVKKGQIYSHFLCLYEYYLLHFVLLILIINWVFYTIQHGVQCHFVDIRNSLGISLNTLISSGKTHSFEKSECLPSVENFSWAGQHDLWKLSYQETEPSLSIQALWSLQISLENGIETLHGFEKVTYLQGHWSAGLL